MGNFSFPELEISSICYFQNLSIFFNSISYNFKRSATYRFGPDRKAQRMPLGKATSHLTKESKWDHEIHIVQRPIQLWEGA